MKEIFEQIDQIKIDIQKVKNNLEAKEASEEEKSGWWRLWVAVVFAILFAIIGYTIYDAYQWKVEQKVTTDMFDPNHLMLVTYVWSPEKIDNEGKIVWDHYDIILIPQQ